MISIVPGCADGTWAVPGLFTNFGEMKFQIWELFALSQLIFLFYRTSADVEIKPKLQKFLYEKQLLGIFYTLQSKIRVGIVILAM